MKSASRTLVKSQPELWELIDQPERMQGLMCGLLGRATDVTVNERRPESVLRWEATEGAEAWIEVELAEKGWGTNVKLKVETGAEPTKLEGWLDAVLEELATPQKRPFEGMDAPPEPVPDREPSPEPEPPIAEEAEPDPEPPARDPEPTITEPEPPAETPEPVAPVAAKDAPKGKLRRFFGL